MKFSRKFRFRVNCIKNYSKKFSRKIEESLANAAKKNKSKNCLNNILFVQNFYHLKIIKGKLTNCEKKSKKNCKIKVLEKICLIALIPLVGTFNVCQCFTNVLMFEQVQCFFVEFCINFKKKSFSYISSLLSSKTLFIL